MFARKVDKAGYAIRAKARLVVKGFSRVHTVHFMKTYLPTLGELCVETVVVVAVGRDRELRQLDVKRAFIQANLAYDAYMMFSDECGEKSSKITKLNKGVSNMLDASGS